MSIDALTVSVGFMSFAFFLLIHFIVFRWLRPEALLSSLAFTGMVVMGLPVLLMGLFFILNVADYSWQVGVLSTVLAMLMGGLLCFVYVLCVFGPYETSVRMRLVREIEKGGKQGLTFSELSKHYNPHTIVRMRLERLIGSGDLMEKDGWYYLKRRQNFFFLFDAVASILRKWIGR